MGVLDRFINSGNRHEKVGNELTDVERTKAAEAVKSILHQPDLVPSGIDIKLQPWEKPVDIRTVAQEVRQSRFGYSDNPDEIYEIAVMPREYDDPSMHSGEYGSDPDRFFHGDGFASKRTEQIVEAKINPTNYSVGESGGHPLVPYYVRNRYFVTVEGSSVVLPRASIYKFADGQVQTLICQYDRQAKPAHYEETINGKVTRTLDNSFDSEGRVSHVVERTLDAMGRSTAKYEATIKKTSDQTSPWRMDSVQIDIDPVSGRETIRHKNTSVAATYEQLYVYSSLRTDQPAMAHPTNPAITSFHYPL